MLTQEIKGDIIFQRLNLPPSVRQVTEPQYLAEHLNSTLHRLHSYLQYIGLAKYAKATTMIQNMMEINLEIPWWCQIGTNSQPFPPFFNSLLSWNRDTKILTHAKTIHRTHMHTQRHTVVQLWVWAHVPSNICCRKYGPAGGGRLSRNVHVPSWYQSYATSNSTQTRTYLSIPKYDIISNAKKPLYKLST